MKRETQYIRLLKYLLHHRSITPLECFLQLGFLRPDRRINEIRNQFGWEAIKTEMIDKNRKAYAKYILNEKYAKQIRDYLSTKDNKEV
jgi:hypothetical protein